MLRHAKIQLHRQDITRYGIIGYGYNYEVNHDKRTVTILNYSDVDTAELVNGNEVYRWLEEINFK